MPISRNLADVLQRINDLVPHREETVHNEIRDAIEAEVEVIEPKPTLEV